MTPDQYLERLAIIESEFLASLPADVDRYTSPACRRVHVEFYERKARELERERRRYL